MFEEDVDCTHWEEDKTECSCEDKEEGQEEQALENKS